MFNDATASEDTIPARRTLKQISYCICLVIERECEGIVHGSLWPLFTSIIHRTEEAAALGEPPGPPLGERGRTSGKARPLHPSESNSSGSMIKAASRHMELKENGGLAFWKKCSRKRVWYAMQCCVIYLGDEYQCSPKKINEATFWQSLACAIYTLVVNKCFSDVHSLCTLWAEKKLTFNHWHFDNYRREHFRCCSKDHMRRRSDQTWDGKK